MIRKIIVAATLACIVLSSLHGLPCIGQEAQSQVTSSLGSAAVPVSLKAPVDLVATRDDSSEEVHLTWTLNDPSATGFIVLRRSQFGGPFTTIDRISRSNPFIRGVHGAYTDYGMSFSLEDGVAYYYIIVATTAGGLSKHSNEAGVTLFLRVPGMPSELTAQAGDKAVCLNWDVAERADSYNIYRSLNHSRFKLVGHTATEQYRSTSLLDGVRYIYYVKAFNSAGEGPPSDHVEAVPFHTLSTAQEIVKVASAFCRAVGQPVSTPTSVTFPAPLLNSYGYVTYWKPRWLVTFDTGIDVQVVDGSSIVCSYFNSAVVGEKKSTVNSTSHLFAMKEFPTVLKASSLNTTDLGPAVATKKLSGYLYPQCYAWDIVAKRQFGGLPYLDQQAEVLMRADTGRVFSFLLSFSTPAPDGHAKRISASDAVIYARAVLAKVGITDLTPTSTTLVIVEPKKMYMSKDPLVPLIEVAKVAWDCYFSKGGDSYHIWIDATDGSTLGGPPTFPY